MKYLYPTEDHSQKKNAFLVFYSYDDVKESDLLGMRYIDSRLNLCNFVLKKEIRLSLKANNVWLVIKVNIILLHLIIFHCLVLIIDRQKPELLSALLIKIFLKYYPVFTVEIIAIYTHQNYILHKLILIVLTKTVIRKNKVMTPKLREDYILGNKFPDTIKHRNNRLTIKIQ